MQSRVKAPHTEIGVNMPRGKLLLVPEIAERLRRSEQAVRYQIHKGVIAPTAVVAGRRVMAEEDLERFIEAQFDDAPGAA